MEDKEHRRVIIGQIQMANRKGLYSSPSIEPEGCSYVRTFDGGPLSANEPGKIDYDDFDLYHCQENGTYSYRFWRRHVDSGNGKETSRSYAEPVGGFTTESDASQHALSVYRGEQPEHLSPELKEWRQQAWWLAMSVVLQHQIRDDPAKVPEIYRMVTGLRNQVHPAAKIQWERLERDLELALRRDITELPMPPAEWHGAAQWGRKLDKAWNTLEKAHKELLSAIKVPTGHDIDLLDKVQTSLINYLDIARRTRDARDREIK